uniref:VENN motif pre-toxin domain-containing protein n=1 Tax=Otariodibacter sp. TaxID=3030919 RepID=UPI002622C3DE
ASGTSAETLNTIGTGMGIAKNAVENNSILIERLRDSAKEDVEYYKDQVGEMLDNNPASQINRYLHKI